MKLSTDASFASLVPLLFPAIVPQMPVLLILPLFHCSLCYPLLLWKSVLPQAVAHRHTASTVPTAFNDFFFIFIPLHTASIACSTATNKLFESFTFKLSLFLYSVTTIRFIILVIFISTPWMFCTRRYSRYLYPSQ